MQAVPRLIIGSTLAVGTFLTVENYIEQPAKETYAVKQVQDCVAVLGAQAITQSQLLENCGQYRDDFKPTAVTGSLDKSRYISYLLPKPVELLTKELPGAAIADQNIIKHNNSERTTEWLIAGMAGLIVGTGASIKLEKVKVPSLGRKKRSLTEQPQV
ncbi:MAG: hypothetical protein QFB87_04235 [Patescibacteria group bacterium]|nr:hypothetical protein [Patescibacteria group bacterium]